MYAVDLSERIMYAVACNYDLQSHDVGGYIFCILDKEEDAKFIVDFLNDRLEKYGKDVYQMTKCAYGNTSINNHIPIPKVTFHGKFYIKEIKILEGQFLSRLIPLGQIELQLTLGGYRDEEVIEKLSKPAKKFVEELKMDHENYVCSC